MVGYDASPSKRGADPVFDVAMRAFAAQAIEHCPYVTGGGDRTAAGLRAGCRIVWRPMSTASRSVEQHAASLDTSSVNDIPTYEKCEARLLVNTHGCISTKSSKSKNASVFKFSHSERTQKFIRSSEIQLQLSPIAC
jgi:hypothetical protein